MTCISIHNIYFDNILLKILVSLKMNQTTVGSVLLSSSSISPCSANEIAISPGDCVESGVEEWLEDETLAGFRVWQLAGIILSILLSIIIGLCCCIRFRIPRTKQEIEADYIRKKITKNFRKELSKINNSDMDEMNLQKALEKIRNEFDPQAYQFQKEHEKIANNRPQQIAQKRINTIFTGMRDHLNK
ncbi:transmembrane inner ear expressed protein-like isoform X1 [Vespa mandarinia]|uniref:transmembrane inner ear expressed protein-like isoform X1 n=1 Tax=Vespa mandarinia TaxID=7446 RepID=UPI00161D2C8A|nr:transmembrane inner ear expressed protein-like isoform X1 [Vespa mandarinia]